MQRKIRIPDAPGLEARKPENTRCTFIAVEGRMVMVIELPDGTRAVGRADIERIDLDFAPDGEMVEMLVSKDASVPSRRRGGLPAEVWERRENLPADA